MITPENWDGITELVAVAETTSFTEAGKRLGISTAQVSRKITALEKRLGSKLLNRTTRVVTTTDTGQQFYHHCRQLLDQLEDAERLVCERQITPSGRLTLTAPVTYGERVIAPLVNDFALQYPDLEVHINLTNRVLDLINGNYDLAIRLGHLENSSLVARRLGKRTLYTCASPEYFKQHGRPRSVSDLSQHRCLVSTSANWQFLMQNRQMTFRARGRINCNSGIAIRDAALKNMGIIQLPDYYVQEDLNAGRLEAVLNDYQVMDNGIWAVYPQTQHVSAKVRLILDFLIEKSSP